MRRASPNLVALEDRDVPAPLGVLAPAYYYPTPGGSDWDKLTAAAPYVPVTAIVNPASGPGTAPDPNYASAIDHLRAAAGKVIGYVHTSFATIPLPRVYAEINRYFRWYHLDGIFVDEMTSDATARHVSYYTQIDNYIHKLAPRWTVVGNPGTNISGAYTTTANTLVTFENGSGYETYTPPAWATGQPARRFANIAYAVSSVDVAKADVQRAASRNAGWVYVTDADLPDPYAGLPTYWSDLVAAVAEQNSGVPGGGLTTAFFVSPTGNNTNPGTFVLPFKTVGHALAVANQPGDTIEVRAGTYHEKLSLPTSGTADAPITLEAYRGERPVLDGTGVANRDAGYGNNIVQMINVSHVRLIGFAITGVNGTAASDASGVHVEGAGSDVVIRGNVIHGIGGVHGMGISAYGSVLDTPLDGIVVDHNTVFNCRPADSETVTLNGNVSHFQITNNLIHDCNNIGIDMIGGDASIFDVAPRVDLPVARDGVCTGNRVFNIHAGYGGGFAGGIYVDGGKNITVAGNVSYRNDIGVEVGAETPGYVASGVVVQNNIAFGNTKSGIAFGGFDADAGRVENCTFVNNTLYANDTSRRGYGQLWIQWASNNVVTNNILVAAADGMLVASYDPGSNVNNVLDHNLYYAAPAVAARFGWNGTAYLGLDAFRTGSGGDAASLFVNPLLVDAAHSNFRLQAASAAAGAGSTTSGQFAPTDFTGLTRDTNPDIGAFEYVVTS